MEVSGRDGVKNLCSESNKLLPGREIDEPISYGKGKGGRSERERGGERGDKGKREKEGQKVRAQERDRERE